MLVIEPIRFGPFGGPCAAMRGIVLQKNRSTERLDPFDDRLATGLLDVPQRRIDHRFLEARMLNQDKHKLADHVTCHHDTRLGPSPS
jgi:hypothetical protein